MRETALPEPTERQFEVKLYHPDDPGAPCRYSGQSERFQVTATDTGDLRTQVESTPHTIFNGDTCKGCGSLAKVSVQEN